MDEDKLRKRKQRAKKDGNSKQLANIVKELGDVYFQAGRLEEALEEYTEQLEVCKTLEDKLNTALAHRMIGEIHTNLGNYEEALSHQVIYLEVAKETDNLIEQQRAYATLGRTYFCLGDASEESSSKREHALADAKKAYSKSLKLCDKLENTNTDPSEIMMMRARLLLNLGLVLEVQKEVSTAIELIETATELCQKHKLNDDLCRIYSALGALHERQENFDESLKYYNLSGKITNDPVNLATARVNEAELLTKLGRWPEARKILVQLYVNHKVSSLKETVTKLLKIVASIEKYELELCSESDNKKVMKLYENLGDAAVSGCCYEKAVDYYQKMLACAEKEPFLHRKKINDALVSLAQTLVDDERFEEAIIYARRELELCTDDKETCRSALFLSDLLTNVSKTDVEIRNLHQLALNSATNCKDISLQLKVLNQMYDYLCEIGATDETESINDQLNSLKRSRIDDSESPNNSEADESIDTAIAIDVDELSDVEREMQKKSEKSRVGTRRTAKKGCVIKRNEKGETKLHVACINNNIEEVKSLLASGHSVNVRDYCGWTPLHEASNFGHIEIAELLIDHGANINDPGGSQCGNITPLHDAASCGNFGIMNLLIARGADLSLKTKTGETILDCFENWRSRLEEDRRKKIVKWSENDEREYKLIRDKLRLVLPAKSSRRSSDSIPLIDEDDKFSQQVDRVDDKNDEEIFSAREMSPEKISAGEDYRRTIESLKNRNFLKRTVSLSRLKKGDSSEKNSNTPLIDSEQQLVDDWLEDDMFETSNATSSHSLKRMRSEEMESPVMIDENSSDSIPAAPIFDSRNFKKHKSLESNHSGVNKQRSQSKRSFGNKHKQKSLLKSGFSRSISPVIPSSLPSSFSSANMTSLPISVNSNEPEHIPSSSLSTDAINFRVNLDNTIMNLRIKNSEEENYLFNNLMNEIMKQFHQNTGCSAKVVLSTADGETLHADNLPNLVYTSQGNIIQLYGQLVDLVIPKITERYKAICAALNIRTDDDIKQLKSLRACEHTEILRLKDDDENINIEILLKAMEYEKSLKIFDLSSCDLFNLRDQLNTTLLQLPQLQELHLASCDIDYNCIIKIDKLPLQLRILDLSYNPLGDKSDKKLSELIFKLRFLQILNLRNCQLKKLPFDSMNISPSLINLDVSWNVFDNPEIDSLLQRQLISLSLSHTLSRSIVTSETRLMALETLESLELAGCNINDSDVLHLLDKCKNLSKLVLNNNPNVSHVSLEKLLENKPTLSLIDITGCKTITEIPRRDLIIDNPSICTMMASMKSYVSELWELLWQGHAKQYRMPNDIVILKPFL